ncbi:MAG TPA: TonB C-terminal domain-containing protein [Candidatus Hydrogenedentes bacterium]|nr:TonB C-terminal domain-containing protein [Candidatus Hydrogenedentota bacterium]
MIQVQRKVERMFAIPSGIYMDAAENIAEVSFWVDRNGNLLGTPTVTKAAADPALGDAGVNAILLANPFPPLPADYAQSHAEQLVIYGFTLSQ